MEPMAKGKADIPDSGKPRRIPLLPALLHLLLVLFLLPIPVPAARLVDDFRPASAGAWHPVFGSPAAKPISRCARPKRVTLSIKRRTFFPLSRKYSATLVAT